MVDGAEDIGDYFLILQGRKWYFKLGYIGTPKTIKNCPDIDISVDLVPPLWTSDRPSKEGLIEDVSRGSQKDKVLPKRTLKSRWDYGGNSRITSPREYYVARCNITLYIPRKHVLSGYHSRSFYIDPSFLEIGDGYVGNALVLGGRSLMNTVDEANTSVSERH